MKALHRLDSDGAAGHRRRFVSATFAAVIGLVLAGCGSGEEESVGGAGESHSSAMGHSNAAGDTGGSGGAGGGTLTVAVDADVVTLDPQAHRTRLTQSVLAQMYNYLVDQDADFNYVPELAESWSKVDDLTWEFKLRPGVKFWNGDPLTAESVKGTYERLMDPEMKSPRTTMNFQTDIEKIEVVDDLTIRFHTAYDFGPEDDPSFLGVFNQEIINPDYAEEVGEDVFAKQPMGTGAFVFDEWVPGQRIVMHANPDYWGEKAKADKLIIRPIPEASTRTSELLAGSVDMAFPVDTDTVTALGDQVTILTGAGTRQWFLGMNVTEGPFVDLEVRQAMNAAIDKQAIVDGLFAGYADVGNQVAFAAQSGFDENYQGDPFDLEAAKAVLSTVTEPLTLDTDSTDETEAAALAEQLRQAGLNVTINSMESAAFTEYTDAGKSQLFFTSFGAGTGRFVGAFYNRVFDCESREGGIILTGFCDPALDEKLASPAANAGMEARDKVDREVNIGIMEQMPMVPLWNVQEIWGAGKNVAGFTVESRFDLSTVTVK